MRLTCAPNKTKSVFASRISWWLQTDCWPPAGAEVRHTCGKSHCVAFAHLRLVTLEERCKRTEEMKQEMRARYARRMSVLRRVFGRQAEDKRLKGAVTRTAEETWVGRETVLRILRGKRTTPTHWKSRESTAEDVRAVYARYAKQEAEHRVQLAAVAKHTMAQMAKDYGVCAKTVSQAVFNY